MLYFKSIKNNAIGIKLFLAGDRFMPEIHSKQLGFTYSGCGPFTTNKYRIKKFKETEDSRYIYQNELDKACFEHDIAYGDFKNLIRRTAADKVLRNKAFNIAKNPKYDGYRRGLQWFIIFLIKKLLVEQLKMKLYLIKNYLKNYANQLLENLGKEKYTHLL